MLAAAGRFPNVRGLGLETTGLRLDAHGMPAFDARTQLCAGAPILIAGDADGWRPVLHEAACQGEAAGANSVALVTGPDLRRPEPWPRLAMVFTHPQAAAIGASYDAEADGRITGGMSFSDQGCARVEGQNRGGMRIRAERDGRPLGGEMLGLGVEHLAHRLAHAVETGSTAQAAEPADLSPTLEEGLGSCLSGVVRAIAPSPGDAPAS